MAKIEMDISEYEAIKKVEKLLENSLQREKELSGAVEVLQEEKIKIMEQNKKSVTIIEEKRIEEFFYQKVDDETIMRNILFIADGIRGKNTSFRDYPPSQISDILIEKFFTKSKMQETPSKNKKVVYKGLDEVKDKIEKVLKDSLDTDVKDKLKRFKIISKEFNIINSKYNSVKLELNICESSNKVLEKKNKKFLIEIKDLKRGVSVDKVKMTTVSNLINNIEKECLAMNIFNKKQRKINISNLVEGWK